MNKQFALKRSVLAVALTLGSAPLVSAQTTPGGTDAPQIQRVIVTGSNIKRIDGETASPVTVLKREDIEASGANTARQVLETLTSFDSTTLTDNGSSSSFAAGASGASLRGLGKGATLVLVNGRRVSNYAFADGGKEVFVNVDTIPADVIDRVEVLTDGASAIYGSDAMAGVINIITRNTFKGLRLSGNFQRPENVGFGGEQSAAITGGFGDLENDGFNVYANLEGYKRFGYMQSDVIASGVVPSWYKQYVSPAYGDPSLLSFPGNINEPRAANHGAIRQAIAGCPPSRVNAGGLCTSDLNGLTQTSDPAKRLNFFSQARFKLGNDIRGFAEVSYSHTESDYRLLPYSNSAGSPSNWFDGNTKTSQSVPKPKLQVGNPANPFSFPVGIDYRFLDDTDMWTRIAKANQYRAMAGLNGTFGKGYDWEFALGRVGADAKTRERWADRTAMPAAVESGEYKIGGPNSPELLARMFPQLGTNAKISQDFVDGKISGELIQLPAGALSFAFGGEARHEKMFLKSTDNVVNAQIISRGSLWIDGQRNMSALFAELNAPITKKLELNGALRMDKSQGFDAHVSPKVGLRYVATPSLMFRGTYAGGFRTPNIPETLGKVGLTGFYNNTLDPKRCATATRLRDILKTGDTNDKNDATTAYNSGCLTSVPVMISSNPDLKPETSRSMTLGFVWEPIKAFNVSVDYYRIERRDEIATRDVNYVLAREGAAGYENLIARNPVSDTDRRLTDRANQLQPGANLAFPVGGIQSMLLSYENFGKTQVSGVDVDMKSRFKVGDASTLSLGLTNTLALTYRSWDVDANAYRPNTVGQRDMPRLVSVFSASLKSGKLTSTIRVNRMSAMSLNYDETDESTWSEAACQARIKPAGDVPCYRRASLRTDLNFAYDIDKSTRMSFFIKNAFLDATPIDLRSNPYVLRPRSFRIDLEHAFF